MAVRLTGKLPKVFAVVENLRPVHVIGAIDLRLDKKEILGIAGVFLQIGGASQQTA